ncbi:hypothetical protein Ancab_037546 [Ancistrocladus abbreviatus]
MSCLDIPMANLRTDAPLSSRIVRAFLDFLNSVEAAPGVDVEGLEVAKDCLTEVFGLGQLSTDEWPEPGLLVNMFNAQGAKEQSEPTGGHGVEVPTVSAQNSVDPSNVSNFQDNDGTRESCDPGVSRDELFGQFFAALEKIHFFRRTPNGDDENALLDRATSLFHDAVKEMESSGCKMFDPTSLAESLKTLGNKAMQSKLYSDAIERYTCAVALNENNAVFYCNRAAAYTQIHKYNEAIRDCRKAIEIDPNYSKAYSRLGLAYYAQGNYNDAISKGFLKALELDPSNDAVKENIKVAEQKLREVLERGQHNQNQSSSGPSNWPPRNHFTGGAANQAAPPPFGSVSFEAGTLPANVASMFMNMATNAYRGQNSENGEAEHDHGSGTPPTFTSMPFDPNALPADFVSMFTSMAANASHGQNIPERPREGSNVGGYDDPGISIGGNISVNIGEQMPEELIGSLRSMMGMFPGGVHQGNQQGNNNR